MITSVTINSLITFPYADFLRVGRYLRRTVFTVSQTLIMLWWSDSQPAGLHTILPSPEFCHRWFAFASWSNQLSGTLTCNFVRNVRILKKYPLMLHGNNDALRSGKQPITNGNHNYPDIERPAVLRQIQEVLKLILELESHCMQDGPHLHYSDHQKRVHRNSTETLCIVFTESKVCGKKAPSVSNEWTGIQRVIPTISVTVGKA
nr:unnamed protein product [Fasciola hepatica]